MVLRHRDVAQLGSALPWGGRGRQFKSDRSDQRKIKRGYYLVFNCSLNSFNRAPSSGLRSTEIGTPSLMM